MAHYALSNIEHDGVLYKRGQEIEGLSDEQFAALEADGVVQSDPLADEPEAATPAPEGVWLHDQPELEQPRQADTVSPVAPEELPVPPAETEVAPEAPSEVQPEVSGEASEVEQPVASTEAQQVQVKVEKLK